MKRHRVVITGMGSLSCLGNNLSEIAQHLKNGQSGITFQPEWEKLSLRSQVGGRVKDYEPLLEKVSKKQQQSMATVALYCCLAAKLAVEDSGLSEETLRKRSTGCLVGSGFTSGQVIYEMMEKLREGRPNRANPYSVLKSMSSTVSANVANVIRVGGRSYSIGSACSTSSHNIGHAFELIRNGILDSCLAGGGDHAETVVAGGFNAMRLALSCNYNETPEKASRSYDRDRDGFVLSEGAGILVLETLEAAKKRKANIYGEILGYAANSDGYDLILPDMEGKSAASCMIEAVRSANLSVEDIDYINTHGTSTVAGDEAEVTAIQKVFKEKIPWFSSTKSMVGHTIGAAGAIEIIHCLLMMQHGFIAPSINIDNIDSKFSGLPINREKRDYPLKTILSNSFGFGGTNAAIVLGKV